MNSLLDAFNNIVTRDDVHLMQSLIEQSGNAIELQVEHLFAEGVYARKLMIPAGTIVVGKIHKYDNLNIMISGEMDVLVGDQIERVKAPFVVVSYPGTKRIAKAITDTVWITIHGTNETDLEKIEDHFIAQSELEYLEFIGQVKLPFEDAKCLT